MSTAKNWTEPRVYTNPDGQPVRVTIYDKDDARELASVGISKHDDAVHVARVKSEFALIAAAPELAAALRDLLGKYTFQEDDGEEARAALAKAGL